MVPNTRYFIPLYWGSSWKLSTSPWYFSDVIITTRVVMCGNKLLEMTPNTRYWPCIDYLKVSNTLLKMSYGIQRINLYSGASCQIPSLLPPTALPALYPANFSFNKLWKSPNVSILDTHGTIPQNNNLSWNGLEYFGAWGRIIKVVHVIKDKPTTPPLHAAYGSPTSDIHIPNSTHLLWPILPWLTALWEREGVFAIQLLVIRNW